MRESDRRSAHAASRFTARLRNALAAACLAGLGVAIPAHAQWSASGRSAQHPAGNETNPAVISDLRGGVIAAWTDLRADQDVYAQRIDSTGALQWGSAGLAVSIATGFQSGPVLVPDGSGGAIVAWTDTRNGYSQVFLQHLSAAGAATWAADGVAASNAVQNQTAPALAPDGAGGVYVAWADEGGGAGNDDIYLRRFNSSGAPATGWATIDTVCRAAGQQNAPRLATYPGGGVVVAWDDARSTLSLGTQTFAQRVSAARVEQWTQNGVALDTQASVRALLAVDAQGRTALAWMHLENPSSNDRVRLQVLTPGGTPALGATTSLRGVASGGIPAALLFDANDSLLVVVQHSDSLKADLVSPVSGGPGPWALPRLVTRGTALGTSELPSVALDAAGGAYIAWTANGTVLAQRLEPDGTLSFAATVAVTAPVTTPQSAAQGVCSDGATLIACFTADLGATTATYAQRYSPSGEIGAFHRVFASSAGGGTALHNARSGRFFVLNSDSTRFVMRSTGGSHLHDVLADGASAGALPNYTFYAGTADHTLAATFNAVAESASVAAAPLSWHGVGYPLTFTPDSVASVFPTLWPPDLGRWRIGHWDPAAARFLEPTDILRSIRPGEGYWFGTVRATNTTVGGFPLAEKDTTLTLAHNVPLATGWNQIANPFPFPVAAVSLRLRRGGAAEFEFGSTADTVTDATILAWDGANAPAAASVLLPGNAYWVWKKTRAAVTLRFPFEYLQVLPPAPFADLPVGADWAVRIVARSAHGAATRVLAGAAADAGPNPGRWSVGALPEAPGGGASLSLRADTGSSDAQSSLFLADALDLAWDLDAQAGANLVETTLEIALEAVPQDRTVTLRDDASGWSRRVHDGERVTLALGGAARRLRLIVSTSPAGPVAGAPTRLLAAGPNPFRDHAAISFALGRAGDLSLEVFDLAGRRIASLGRPGLPAGEHVIQWDGRDAAGRRVAPGLYLVRWRADGRSGSTRLVAAF